MINLKQVENKLNKLVTQDKKTWIEFYKLLKEVEEQELFKQAEKKSFTAWVKDFALANKIHESIIWNRKKAGKVFELYQEVQKEKGLEPTPIENIDVSPDSLVLIDKIAKKDAQIASDLTEKVLAKELSREDLRNAYKAIRGDLEASEDNTEGSDAKEPLEAITEAEEVITAAHIVNALSSSRWLGAYDTTRKPFITKENQNKYRIFTEFSVLTGSSRKSRLIDLVAVENLTVDEFGVNIHGVEIKISKSDLLRDQKYTEYAEFVDYLWLAIPKNLVKFALELKPDVCGIIVIEDEQASIHTQATRLNPLMREQALTNIILKSL